MKKNLEVRSLDVEWHELTFYDNKIDLSIHQTPW